MDSDFETREGQKPQEVRNKIDPDRLRGSLESWKTRVDSNQELTQRLKESYEEVMAKKEQIEAAQNLNDFARQQAQKDLDELARKKLEELGLNVETPEEKKAKKQRNYVKEIIDFYADTNTESIPYGEMGPKNLEDPQTEAAAD